VKIGSAGARFSAEGAEDGHVGGLDHLPGRVGIKPAFDPGLAFSIECFDKFPNLRLTRLDGSCLGIAWPNSREDACRVENITPGSFRRQDFVSFISNRIDWSELSSVRRHR
jgi:hypothetical protein